MCYKFDCDVEKYFICMINYSWNYKRILEEYDNIQKRNSNN